MKPQIVLAWVLLVVLGASGIWDAVCLVLLGGKDTVSRAIYDLCQELAWLPVFIALLIGHLLVPLKIQVPSVKNEAVREFLNDEPSGIETPKPAEKR